MFHRQNYCKTHPITIFLQDFTFFFGEATIAQLSAEPSLKACERSQRVRSHALALVQIVEEVSLRGSALWDHRYHIFQLLVYPIVVPIQVPIVLMINHYDIPSLGMPIINHLVVGVPNFDPCPFFYMMNCIILHHCMEFAINKPSRWI